MREDIEDYQKKTEEVEQAIHLIKDEIDEADEKLFNLQKEKEDKEKSKRETDKRRHSDKETPGAGEEQKEAMDGRTEAPAKPREEFFDTKFYKNILYDTLKQRIEEIS
ncbi:MAG: hypothetical protein P4M11_12615 [Candidatus Pacebacteria bacterium]|nr:hypothetical protein [Candidatus Paceibacterota bacterium]